MHQQAMEAMSEVGERLVENGRLEQAQAVIRKQLTIEPWREAAHQQMMRVLALLGDRGAALAQFELCREQLWEELGVEPVAETVGLFEAIKAGEYGRFTIEAPPPPAITPLQNLPAQTTPLVGREKELEQLSSWFGSSRQRLVTLLGAGGMGKTRLALAFASMPARYGAPQHGVCFVPLAPLSHPDHIIPAIADTLQLSLSSGEPPYTQLVNYLRQKEMLLVLDNFEHLLAGATLVGDLLQQAPHIQILATSRERLQLREEQVYPLQGLAFPESAMGQFPEDPETVQSYAAVKLFIQTAQRVQPSFNLQNGELGALLRICHLLNGMPLAVELAAGWVDMLPLAEIAAEIDKSADFLATEVRNVPERHRSMRAVFDASWQRLTPAEQTVFAQLTLFQGGFTRQAAQAITGALLRLLGRLVNKSLVHYDNGRQRYQIHELLRQYGAEKLAEDHERKTAVSRQHGLYYLQRLHEQTNRLKSQHQQAASTDIERELGNIRIAWQWALQNKAFAELNLAMNALRLFYEWKAQYEVTEKGAQEIMAIVPNPTTPTELRLVIKALAWQATVYRVKGAYERGQTLLEKQQALLDRLAEQVDDTQQEQIEALLLTSEWRTDKDFKEAKEIAEAAYELSLGVGNSWYQAHSLRLCGISEFIQGAYETAELRLQQALTLADQTRDIRLRASILDELSQHAAQLSLFDKAEQYVRQSYTIYQSFSDPLSRASGTGKLGIILVFVGKPAEAEPLLQRSLSLFQELGNENLLAQAYVRLGAAQIYGGQLQEAYDNITKGVTLYRQLHNDGMTGWALWALGEALLGMTRYEEAEQVFAESIVWLQQAGQLDKASWSVGLQGLAMSFLHRDAEAERLLYEGLKMGSELREFLSVLSATAGIALMFAKKGRQEQAAELYGLIGRYPFFARNNEGWTARLSEQIRPFLAQLPNETAEAAQTRGREMDLWETAVCLVDELSASTP